MRLCGVIVIAFVLCTADVHAQDEHADTDHEDDGVAAFNDGGDEHDEHDEQGDNGDVYKGGFTHGSDQNAQDLPKHDGDIPENELWRTTDVEALNEDAQKFFEAEKLEDALKRWQRIIEVDPTNSDAIGSAALTMNDLGRTDEARKVIRDALVKLNHDIGLHSQMLQISAVPAERILSLDRICEEDPEEKEFPGSCLELAMTLMNEKRYGEAEARFEPLVARKAIEVPDMIVYAEMLVNTSKPEQAAPLYTLALKALKTPKKKVDGFTSSVKDLHMDKKEIKEQVAKVQAALTKLRLGQ